MAPLLSLFFSLYLGILPTSGWNNGNILNLILPITALSLPQIAVISRMMRASTIEGSSRALGWDTPSGQASGGVYLSKSSFGHTGFTGTSLWIDPENQIFVILLTNAVHPNRNYKNPNYFDWRQKIHSSVYEALGFVEKRNDLEWRKRWLEN